MCCCEKPNVNGTSGYRWQPADVPIVRPVDPPALAEDETLIFDEPGRCGGVDSHCHHYRVVKRRGELLLAYRHGGGDGRIRLSNSSQVSRALGLIDSDARYWLLGALYHAQSNAARDAREGATMEWRQAAADKRIKVNRRGKRIRVWIEEATK